MSIRASRFLLAALLAGAYAASQAAEITLYRCVDAKGKLTLRDSPCAKGEKQEIRTFQRPVDPPARPVAQKQPLSAPAQPAEIRYVMVNPPRPMYECVAPDGDRYTSDNDAGNPRLVPLWTLGFRPSRGVSIGSGAGNSVNSGIGMRPPPASAHRPPPGGTVYPAIYAGSTYIADECHALPPQEVCDRLNDRRYEIKRRYLNAMPSERAVLDNEERSLVARMNDDCGRN